MLPFRLGVVVVASLAISGEVVAGPVIGKLELPPAPERPAVATKGFLERVENPLAPARGVTVTPFMVVALEGAEKPGSPGQINWDLVGESFSRPVIGAAIGAEVVIKNTSKTARTLVAAEDPKLVPAGPINPTGPKSFRVTEAKVYTIGDPDAPHLKGKLVVVNTPFVSNVDDSGKFEFADVPEGSYKLRVYYKDAWLDIAQDVNVEKKGKTEVSVKVPAFGAGKK
ncbi:MAG: hypothetical protein ABI175_03530 [Polyangiales bacterium]